MNHRLKQILYLCVCSCCSLSAQITYVPSYFITNEGERVECLIKDLEWNMNPTSFEYKLNLDSEVKTESIDHVKVFEVESSKYERFTVDIDMSRNEIAFLSDTKAPEYQEKTVYLKYLIEGEKSLLSYKGKGLRKFFLKTDSEVVQLVYKEYLTSSDASSTQMTSSGGDVAKNELYRGQLLALLGFDDAMQQRIQNLEYNEKSLTHLLDYYHKVNCEECIVYKEDKARVVFLSIKPGVDMADIRTTAPSYYDGLDLGLRTNVCIGLELEYVLPINKSKWSIFFEPTYLMGDEEKRLEYVSNVSTSGQTFVDYSYNVVKLPLGLRYYAFFNNESKLFADVSISYPLVWDSEIKYYTLHNEAGRQAVIFSKIHTGISLSLGYNYKQYAAQIRYNGIRQELAGNYPNYEVSYNSVSIHLAYKFQVFNNQ